MKRRILLLSDLIEVIENKMISIDSVESNVKFSADITETAQITPEKFTESIQLLNKSIFKDAIDFFYEFTGENNILIECGMKNMFMEEYYRVKCSICDGISIEDVDKKFRETIFDRMDKKLAVSKD
ncbi:hypothetical protein IMSAGC019_02980 [Lachnospiraceae bacterium]|nr:hypothetical protein IMSAGC019_02980 [Lachnospiraceae bacterium]